MASTSAVYGFFMKAKHSAPVLEFEKTGEEKEPFKCIVTLGPVTDEEGGFDKRKFEHSARNKKAAKNLVMEKALAFLETQSIYKRTMKAKEELKVRIVKLPTI
jgi:hypothetical protein